MKMKIKLLFVSLWLENIKIVYIYSTQLTAKEVDKKNRGDRSRFTKDFVCVREWIRKIKKK